MAKKSKEVRGPIYQGGRVLDELVVVAPKINTKAKKGTWEYVKAVAKNRKQTAYTRGPSSKERTSDIVVTDSNGQASYYTDPVDGKPVRRGQYTYRSNTEDNSLTSGLQNFLNTTTAGLMDLGSHVPYAAGKALDAVGSPVGKDLIQTSKDLELDARRINRYEVAPADFLSASTLGSLLPSLGLAAVTGGKSLALDANTSRAFTKHITKDLGGSPLLSNILGNVAGAAALMPIGGATLKGATEKALTKYFQSAAKRAALNTGIGVGTAAAPQLFTGDYGGALNTATTIAPIIAGSSIVASGLLKAAAYKGYNNLARVPLRHLYTDDEALWAAERQKLPWYISKKHADRARQLRKDLNDVTRRVKFDNNPHNPKFSYPNLRDGKFDPPHHIPFKDLLYHDNDTALIIPEAANLFDNEIASRINRYIDPNYIAPEKGLLQEAVRQSQRLTGKSINVKNVPQAEEVHRSTAIRDALLRKILQGVYDADNPKQGTIGHYLKHNNPKGYGDLILEGVTDGNNIDWMRDNALIDNPVVRGDLLHDFNYPSLGFSFRRLYERNKDLGLKAIATQEALKNEHMLGVLFNNDTWNLRHPAAGSLTPYTPEEVLALVSKRGDKVRAEIEDGYAKKQEEAKRGPLINKFAEEFEKVKPDDADPLQIEEVLSNVTPREAHALFSRGLEEPLLSKLGLNIEGVNPRDIPLHTRAIHGEGAIDDAIKSGVIRSTFKGAGDANARGKLGAVFVPDGPDALKVKSLWAEGPDWLDNSTPISNYASPDFDLRAGRLSHYVGFDGGRDGLPGGGIVAVTNPSAMVKALGGEYYLLGKPHGRSFSSSRYIQSNSDNVNLTNDGMIPSENTFEHITEGTQDYRRIAGYLGNIEGQGFSNPNIKTTHRTFGKKLGADGVKALEELGKPRGSLNENDIVPIAPPIGGFSLFEFVKSNRAVDNNYILESINKMNDLNFDIDFVTKLEEATPNSRQSHNAIQIANAQKEKNRNLIINLDKGLRRNPNANGTGALYLLPYSEMQRFYDAKKAVDSNYGSTKNTIGGKVIIHSNQF